MERKEMRAMKIKKKVWLVLVLWLMILAGCGGAHKEEIPDTSREPETEVVTSEETEEADTVDSYFAVTYLDVGQANAALVECDGHYMLIDGGDKESSSLMYTVLRDRGVDYLELVVATHAHADHVGGIAGALNYAKAGMVLCPVTEYDTEAFRDFKKYAEQNGNGIQVPQVGDEYRLGSASVRILGVNAGEENDSSIVLKITYGATAFLFAGDAERTAEQAILASGADLSADVLAVGHHGSESSTTYPFLREIMPDYAVISVGKDNTYGHPTDNTLSRLRDAGTTVCRTDLQGDLVAVSDGQTVVMYGERQASQEALMTPGPIIQQTPETAAPVVTEPPAAAPAGTDYIINANTEKFH